MALDAQPALRCIWSVDRALILAVSYILKQSIRSFSGSAPLRPVSALYGPRTARSVQNFPIGGRRFPRSFIRALGIVKSAAARMNGRMGQLPAALAESIEAAAEQVVEGRHDNEFPVDIFQTGSATSTNLNANEMIGHLAGAERLRRRTLPHHSPSGGRPTVVAGKLHREYRFPNFGKAFGFMKTAAPAWGS